VSTLSNQYGSELHLLRYLGRHRTDLDRRILAETGGEAIRWLDFNFDQTPLAHRKRTQNWDIELKGLEFLDDDSVARGSWPEFWPAGLGQITWDAVGQLEREGKWEWLLVEAKAHHAELESSCKASGGDSREMIRRAFDRTKQALGVRADADWFTTYYQFCNRVAALHFLTSSGEQARLVFIYFTGDDYPGKICPASPEEWHDRLANLDRHVGLPKDHALANRIHKLFIPVRRLE